MLAKIQNVFEIRFEQDVLQNLFKEKLNVTQQREILKDEINEND